MDIAPASVDQVRIGLEGRVVIIDAEMSQIVADLQARIPEIRVRFAESAAEPFWAVYLSPEGGCPCPDPVCEHGHLVCTAKAHLTHAGTWAGLDERLVERIAEIDPRGRGHYDYARAVERQNEQARQAQRERARARMDEISERAQKELRDRGVGKPQSTVFVPREVPK